MKPAPFDYFAPTSVEETCALLAHHGDNTKNFWKDHRAVAATYAHPRTNGSNSGKEMRE